MKWGNIYSAFYKNNLKEAHISFSESPNLFTVYYATKFGIFQALLANSGSTLPSFFGFFFLKLPVKWVRVPHIMVMAAQKAFRSIKLHISLSKISHSSLKTI